MKRILVLAFAAALSMSVSACQDSTSPSAVLSGTYTLRTIGGQTLPAPDPSGDSRDIVDGYITIDRNGTFTDVLTYRDFSSGQTYSDTIEGTWALSGNVIAFTDPFYPNDPYYASVSGSELVFSNSTFDGLHYTVVYAK